MTYCNRHDGLGIAIPGIITAVPGILPKIPVIGGIFAKGMCPPTLPGTVGTRCRNKKQHFYLARTGPGGQVEMWHTSEHYGPRPMLMRLFPNGEWGGFHKQSGRSGWMDFNDPRVPQLARDTWTAIYTGRAQLETEPGVPAPAPPRAGRPAAAAPAVTPAGLPLIIGVGIALAALARKK